MTKIYKINIQAQSFEFENVLLAKEKAKDLINAGLWHMELEEVNKIGK